MRRISVSAPAVLAIAACVTCLPIATTNAFAGQLLDPGWQLGYVVQSNPGGGGVIASMFGDGPAPMVAYQPAPMYQAAPMYRPVPMYQQAPMYQPAPQARGYMPAPVYYQPAVASQARVYQPATAYYQQVPAVQAQAYRPAPVYYQQAPVVPAHQPRAASYQPAPTPARQAPSQSAPQYTGTVQTAQVAPQSAATQQTAPKQSLLQPTPSWHQPETRPTPTGPPQNGAASAPVTQQGFFQFSSSWHQPATQPAPAAPPTPSAAASAPAPRVVAWGVPAPAYAPSEYGDMAHPMVDPKYDRQVVDYQTTEQPGTIVVDTRHYFLYLVMEDGKALRYGIGVGREGFTWSGVNEISAMREWPDWVPPPEMLQRRPDLPRYVAGGVDNPLGARALYLGSTLYRIHGSNEPWTIGTNVSSGCIRLRNADVEDLYSRVKVGTKVVVL